MNILITIPVKDDIKASLRNLLPDGNFVYTSIAQVTDAQIRNAHIIMGNVPAARLGVADKLKWMQLNSAGADQYVKPGILKGDVLLTNATGAYGLALSEHMLGVTFFLKKKLGLYHKNQMQSLWKDEGEVTGIMGSTTLVVGLGDIGRDYGQKMQALGSRVKGIKRTPGEKPDYIEELGVFEDLDRLIPEADIIALCLPNTPETSGIWNRKRFGLMKEGSILINIGRGSAIEEAPFLEALEKGPMAGASIDVTSPEPLPADHPLWSYENLLITPHVAGAYHLKDTLENISGICVRNLEHFLKGEPMENPVDKNTGYTVSNHRKG